MKRKGSKVTAEKIEELGMIREKLRLEEKKEKLELEKYKLIELEIKTMPKLEFDSKYDLTKRERDGREERYTIIKIKILLTKH